MDEFTPEESAQMDAVLERLLQVADDEIAALGHIPQCAIMALICATQRAIDKHGRPPEAAASLIQIGFAMLGATIDADALVRSVVEARAATEARRAHPTIQ